MKRLLLSALLAIGLCSVGYSQTNNTTTVPIFLEDVWNTMIGQGLTNISATIYGTFTPSIKEWGEGLIIMRNIPIGGGIATGVGIGLDHYSDDFYAVSAQVTLSASLRPLQGFGATNVVVTPFTFVGLGTPFGNNTDGTSGNLETIASVGAAVRMFKLAGGYMELMGTYGTRTGIGPATGTFYGGGLTWFRSF